MLNTPRFRIREDDLKKALYPQKMEYLWRNNVKSILRDQPFWDLHDYYDFNINLLHRIESIRESIFDGTYQPARPIRVKSEKKVGISRQLVILFPEDALVFESIGEYLFHLIIKSQPSQKAFFSRNQRQPKSIIDFDVNAGYPWWILWPEFQKQILEFAHNCKYTIVTDISNYYDCIDFNQLRNYLASLDQISEVLMDFLFFLLERFVWRPDYLPFPGRGLPQINLDAPRLVAHAFLFEIDSFLTNQVHDNFVRWMDDINIGCNSLDQAKYLIGSIDDLLLSRGLRLNPSKTSILSSTEAYNYFQINENLYLNKIQDFINHYQSLGLPINHPKFLKLRKFFRRKIRKILTGSQSGYWSKIVKRYFNIAGHLKDSHMDKYVPNLLESTPDLRETIFRYYINIGWSKEREEIITNYLYKAVDDVSFLKAISVLLKWQPKSLISYSIRMQKLTFDFSKSNNSTTFIGSLWIIAKFGNDFQIDSFLTRTIDIWKSNDWLARQVASIWPRLRLLKTKENIINTINTFGLKSARSVIENFTYLSSQVEIYTKKVKPYIYALNKDDDYTLPKLLICLSLLQNSLPFDLKKEIKKEITKKLRDPYFRNLINRESISP